jgi:hypothetical protein
MLSSLTARENCNENGTRQHIKILSATVAPALICLISLEFLKLNSQQQLVSS